MTDLKEKIKAVQINLIKELGIDKLKPEQQEKLVMQIGEILQQRVVMRIIEELPDEKQDEFKEILDKASEDPKLVDDFLTENVPGIEDMILEEIGDYKQGATEFMKQALGSETKETSNPEEKPVEEVIEPAQEVEPSQPEESAELAQPVEEVEEKPEIEVVEKIKESQEPEKSEETSGMESEPMPDPSASSEEEPEITLEGGSSEEKKEDDQPKEELSGIEEEQAEKEAQILEENKVDEKVVQGEELDLTNEIEKMDTEKKEE